MQSLSMESLIRRHPGIVTRQEKMYYVTAALSTAIMKADGNVSRDETATAIKIAEKLGLATASKSEVDSYLKGTDDFAKKFVTIQDLMNLISVFEQKEEKLNLLKVLIKLSSSDGTLDKAEYSIISKVAGSLKVSIPEFGTLAEKLNIGTGNAARDRQFEMAGTVIKTIGKGVMITAILGLKIIELLVQDGSTQHSKKRPASKKKSVADSKPKAKEIHFTYRAGSKNCALCRHWQGQRIVEPNKKQVQVALHGQPRGVCSASPGGKRIVLASHTCHNFSSVI